MSYTQILPSPFLRPYIARYMVIENLPEEVYKVAPKPAIVMGVQYKGGISVLENGKERKLKPSGITGLKDTFGIFRNTADTGTILIEFRSQGLAKFFEFPVNQISGNSLSLEELTSPMLAAELEEKVSLAETTDKRIFILEQLFLSRLETGKTDPLVEEAVKRICHFKGNLRIAELASSLCISQRQFEKRFLRTVGASPKKFSSLVRFEHLLKIRQDFTSLTELSLEAGYYDQAHFIRDFKSYLGLTPEQFFAGSSRDTFR